MSLCREKTLWSAEVSNDFMERMYQRKGAEKKRTQLRRKEFSPQMRTYNFYVSQSSAKRGEKTVSK